MTKFELPNLANATPGYLVDRLAEVRAKMSVLKKLEDVFKEGIKARATEEEIAAGIRGDSFELRSNAYSRHAVNQQAVKDFASSPKFLELIREAGFDPADLFSDTIVTVLKTETLPGTDINKYYGVEDEDIFKDWSVPDFLKDKK